MSLLRASDIFPTHTTMKLTHAALLACPVAMIFATTGYSIAKGALPGTVGLLSTGQVQTASVINR